MSFFKDEKNTTINHIMYNLNVYFTNVVHQMQQLHAKSLVYSLYYY